MTRSVFVRFEGSERVDVEKLKRRKTTFFQAECKGRLLSQGLEADRRSRLDKRGRAQEIVIMGGFLEGAQRPALKS
jgi:hypothetical protein